MKTVVMNVTRPISPTEAHVEGAAVTIADDLAEYYIGTGAARYATLQQTDARLSRRASDGVADSVVAPGGDLAGVNLSIVNGNTVLAGADGDIPLRGSTAAAPPTFSVSASNQTELDAILALYPSASVVSVSLTGRSYGAIGIDKDYSRWTFSGIAPDSLTSSSVVSVSGTGTARIVVLQMTAALPADIAVNDWLSQTGSYTSAVATGTNPASLVGAWQISAVDSGLNQLTVKLNRDADVPSPSGAVALSWKLVRTKVFAFALNNGQIGSISNCVVDLCNLDKQSMATFVAPSVLKDLYLGDNSYCHAEYASIGKANVNYRAFLRADYAAFYLENTSGYGLYLENLAHATAEFAFYNGARIHCTNRSFATVGSSWLTNTPTGAAIEAVNGGYVTAPSMVSINLSAAPYSPAINTAGADQAYISSVAAAF